MDTEFLSQRARILQQMASLDTMEEGSLRADFRPRPSGGQVGPYYKHQVWKEGHNITRHVPADQAGALQEAIANRQQFEQLAAQFVSLTIDHTRQTEPLAGVKKKSSPSAALKKKRSSS